MTIHWCGTGLSALPGLMRLISDERAIVVWNRPVDPAREMLGETGVDMRDFDLHDLADALAPRDIVVSMLPADHHLALAKICLAHRAHFVSSSYISPEMQALDEAFRDAGLRSVNEVGLDPGIDHLMAHDLVAAYRASPAYRPDNVLSFTSYCGGVPKQPNAFRYKFSWSPLGVLRALRAPSRSLRNFSELRVAHPWEAVTTYDAPLPQHETFEVYPNRDSLPFLQDYRFDPEWRVRDFVRGTLRLNGWADAWAPIFAELGTLTGAKGEARLEEMAAEVWRDHGYAEDEPDRVVLFVSLKAEQEGRPVWHQTWAMDAWGDARGTAMSRLVSTPVALAVEAVLAREIPAGVHPAPHDPKLVTRWLGEVARLAQYLARVDHLA